jgi:glycine oxidase
MPILIKGAGVAGLAVAYALSTRGFDVAVADRAADIDTSASWLAGGMLAPFCERESAGERVLIEGRKAADWWDGAVPGAVIHNGTLVVAPPRDSAELSRFASRTSGFEWIGEDEIAALEPALAGRFRKALFFPGEAHLDPRLTLGSLRLSLAARGVSFHFGPNAAVECGHFHEIIDCTGAAMIGKVPELRGVRGEMLYLETSEIALSRPVRLLHPRHLLYVVPRRNNRFMVGATMIESGQSGRVTARSLMELLNAAYALHPAFGEALVIETASGVRPAFPDNFPRVFEHADSICLNGLYRHGFLLAPVMAEMVAERLVIPTKYLISHPPMTGALS